MRVDGVSCPIRIRAYSGDACIHLSFRNSPFTAYLIAWELAQYDVTSEVLLCTDLGGVSGARAAQFARKFPGLVGEFWDARNAENLTLPHPLNAYELMRDTNPDGWLGLPYPSVMCPMALSGLNVPCFDCEYWGTDRCEDFSIYNRENRVTYRRTSPGETVTFASLYDEDIPY